LIPIWRRGRIVGPDPPEENIMTLPSLFLSHGAPTLPLSDTPARTFLAQLGAMLERPKAILVVSAHWETAQPTVNAVDRNDTCPSSDNLRQMAV
jgi:aromatic ring-opening dioxygenase catalytic subunit (LigB family)